MRNSSVDSTLELGGSGMALIHFRRMLGFSFVQLKTAMYHFDLRNGQCRVIARPKWQFELEPKQAPLPSEWLDELVHANIITALPKTTTNNKIGWYDLGFTHAGQYYLFIQ